MQHRGPDDSGVYEAPGQAAILGNQRLSIIDRSDAGHMPMVKPADEVAVTFNGEIYNHVELREELRDHGYSFDSRTDTEVLLNAYLEWGQDCLDRLNGMWGFAIWDGRKEALFVSRDRLGIKPLYYTQLDDLFVVASEIKPILQLSEVPVAPNEDAIRTFLERGLIDGTAQTFFEDIRRLDPGSQVVVTDELTHESYWELDADAPHFDDPANEIGTLLSDSVRLRLRSDVDNGISLSGGLDSSSISALVAGRSDEVRTFSSIYDDPEYDEREYIRQMVDSFDLDGTEITPGTDSFLDTVSEILTFLEEPSKHYGVYSQWHVMERAAEDVTVMLDGQGADELFAGYYSFYPTYHRSLLNRSRDRPSLFFRLLGERIGATRFRGGVSSIFPSSSTFLPSWLASDAAETAEDLSESVLAEPFLETTTPLEYEAFDGFDEGLNNQLATSTLVTSLPSLLRDEDKISMAFSIESRVPFLDHRLVEAAFRTSEDKKIYFGWTKHVLRKAVTDILPDSVTWRRDKKGYPTPLKRWIGEGNGDIERLLTSDSIASRGIVDADQLAAVYDRHVAGDIDATDLLWRVLQVELWYRLFIDSERFAQPTSGQVATNGRE